MITVNGQTLRWRESMTVTDILVEMDYTALNLITVFVDGEHVPREDYDSTVIPDGAQVKALHLHHGG